MKKCFKWIVLVWAIIATYGWVSTEEKYSQTVEEYDTAIGGMLIYIDEEFTPEDYDYLRSCEEDGNTFMEFCIDRGLYYEWRPRYTE